jgi:large subunit ribosomal protein L30
MKQRQLFPRLERQLIPRMKLKITQTRSQIGQTQKHRGTLRALGLGKIGRSVEREDTPETLGMLRKVRHLVRVDEE